jgi:hypothetical protein
MGDKGSDKLNIRAPCISLSAPGGEKIVRKHRATSINTTYTNVLLAWHISLKYTLLVWDHNTIQNTWL